MSTHPQSATVIAGADVVSKALADLPTVISFLPPDADAFFIPINTNQNWATSFGKRALDLAIALPAMLLLAPVFAVLALLVKLDSKGPVLFRQTRAGLCGRPFAIFKFRTMHVMEDGERIVQARANDPRTTRIGRVLRRYSLDELPQLLNVILGDMSLVGPRPHALAHDAQYAPRIADYTHRHATRPGITGWAQIHGHRGPTPTLTSMSDRVDYDVWYVRNASFGLDLKILLRTPLEIFHPRNAC